jgi:drug/metabolite transporter (DMT)-like permease
MRPIHLLTLVALSVIWGASFMFIKIMVGEMSPIAVGWLRLAGGTTLIAAVAVGTGRRLPRTRGYWRGALVLAALGGTIPLVVIPWGQREIPSNLGAVLNGAMPFWVAILATIFLPAERVTLTKAVGVLIGFAGLALIIGPDALDLRAGSTQGQLAIVGATACYAGAAVFTRRNMLGVDSTILAGMQNGLGFLMLTPLILLAGDVPDFGALSTRVVLATLALAFLGQGIAMILYYWLLSNVEATQASFVTYLAPIAAQFWGWAVLSEVPTVAMVPGLALIITGIVIVNRRPRLPVSTLEPARTRGGGDPEITRE